MSTNTEAKTRMKSPTTKSLGAMYRAVENLHIAWGEVCRASDYIPKSDYETIYRAFQNIDNKLCANGERMEEHLSAQHKAKIVALVDELEQEEVDADDN